MAISEVITTRSDTPSAAIMIAAPFFAGDEVDGVVVAMLSLLRFGIVMDQGRQLPDAIVTIIDQHSHVVRGTCPRRKTISIWRRRR